MVRVRDSQHYQENEFPLELGRHLSLDQCEALIPDGPGGWRKVSSVLMCLVKYAG